MATSRNRKAERNTEVKKLMEELIKKANKNEYSLKPEFTDDLDTLFSTNKWGFREITLVITIARLLDENYKASEAFYACNPRPLYEQPIREVLSELKVPNRKSGPLNVAKATVGINDEWAGQRRPAHVAKSVVNLVGWIEAASREELENFAVCLQAKFLNEAQRIEALAIDVAPESDPYFIHAACCRLVNEATDSGNTPQRIFGLLLYTYHQELDTGIVVTGYEDRASTTSTTSKKPGDVNEETESGEILRVYEVTLKPFSTQRIGESYDTLKAYEEANEVPINEVIVVCRKEDVPEGMEEIGLSGVLGRYIHQDVIYYFVDLFEWMMLQLIKMTSESRVLFYELLNDYISHPDTAEDVKRLWIEINN